MNSAQYQFFNTLVVSARESRLQMHDIAWMLLGVLLTIAILFLAGFWLWLLRGGFDNYFCLNSVHGQRIVHEWLQKS